MSLPPLEFTRVFEQYHGMVFRTAYRITGNAADAEDVLQTIFLRLLRQNTGAAPITKEESYFRRAAVNASLDLLRARRADLPLLEVADRPQGAAPELRECLRRAFVTLSPRAAEMFVLRYLEDFSNQQIARALQVSQVLVAVTLHRARRQLQKEIRSQMEGTL